jgi:hypothetical protein
VATNQFCRIAGSHQAISAKFDNLDNLDDDDITHRVQKAAGSYRFGRRGTYELV